MDPDTNNHTDDLPSGSQVPRQMNEICIESTSDTITRSSFQPLQLQPPGILLESPVASQHSSRRLSTTGHHRIFGGSLVNPLSRLKGQCTRVQDQFGIQDGPRTERSKGGMQWRLRKYLWMPFPRGAQSDSGHPPMWKNDRLEEENEDADTHERSRNLIVYINSAWVIGLTIADIVAFFSFQLFSHPVKHTPFGEFLCSQEGDVGISYNIQNVTILAVIILLYFCFIVQHSRARQDGEAKSYILSPLMACHWITLAASVIVLILHTQLCSQLSSWNFSHSLLFRSHMVVHILRVVLLVISCQRFNKELRQQLQRAVSEYRRRYVDQDMQLDLDLTYIADRVIAMSIPCVDSAVYRNDMADVARFFASKHYGSFAVLNLCEHHEESGNGNYHPSLLFGQVQKAPMRDHNAPAFQTLVDFCDAATHFLNAGAKNVVAVHCQGGKGRTGLFVCALLLWVGLCDTAQEAVEYYARRRSMRNTPRHKRVRPTSPSQLRYLGYMEKLLSEGFEFAGVHPLVLERIMITQPPTDQAAWSVALVIEQGRWILFDFFKARGSTLVPVDRATATCFIDVADGLVLNGDVTLRIFLMDSDTSAVPPGTPAKIVDAGRGVRYGAVKGTQTAFVTFHTAPVSASLKGTGGVVTFHKEEIDGAYVDTRHRKFQESFSIAMEFSKDEQGLWGGVDFGVNDSAKDMVAAKSTDMVAAKSTDMVCAPSTLGNPPRRSPALLPSRDGVEDAAHTAEHGAPPPPPGAAQSTDAPSIGKHLMAAQSKLSGEKQRAEKQSAEAAARCGASSHEEFLATSSPISSLGGSERRHSMPRRKNSVVKAQTLCNVIAKACHTVRDYHHGEVVLDTTLQTPEDHIEVLYILSGRVQMEPLKHGIVGGWSGCLGMPDISQCATVGPGHLFGLQARRGLGRMVPVDATLKERELSSGGGWLYTVKSDQAHIAVVRMSRALHDQTEDEQDKQADYTNYVIYESLAQRLDEWSSALRTQHMLQKQLRKCSKCTATALAARAHMHERVMTLHSLPQNEKVLTSCEASHVSRKRTNGQLLLFKNWLVFRALGASTTSQDVRIALEKATSLSFKKDVLTIHCDAETSLDGDTPHSTVSAVSGDSPTQIRPKVPLSALHGPGFGASSKRLSGTAGSSCRKALRNPANSSPPLRTPHRTALSLAHAFSQHIGESDKSLDKALRAAASDVSFVLRAGTGSGPGSAGAMVEKVRKQLKRVRSRLSGMRDHLDDSKPKEESAAGKRRGSMEGSDASREELLRKWGFVLAGERVSPQTWASLAVLVAGAPRHSFKGGEAVVQAGSEEKQILFILSGKVSSCSALGEKLDVRQAGDMIGSRNFFSGGNHGYTTTYIAETDAQVAVIQRMALETTCLMCPAAAARFFRSLAMNTGASVSWQFELLEEEEEEEAESMERAASSGEVE